jgi:hypothetical protein
MLEGNGEIIFPMSIPRRARIVGNHGRAALRQKQLRERNEQRRKYGSR